MSQRFYPASARNWFTLDSVQLQANGSSASYIGRQNIYAPVEYSFRCQSVSSFQDPLLVLNNTSPSNLDWRLNFVDFQVRPLRCVLKDVLSGESFCCSLSTFSVLRSRFKALVWPTQQISPTPATAQASSPRGFGWAWWPRCCCCGYLCTVCTWSCS